MTEQLISLHTAKLALSRGFGNLDIIPSHLDVTPYIVTQSILQKWLRDNFKIHVFIGFRPNVKKWDAHAYSLLLSGKEYVKEQTLRKYMEQPIFDKYEDALEFGLEEALKMIKV